MKVRYCLCNTIILRKRHDNEDYSYKSHYHDAF